LGNELVGIVTSVHPSVTNFRVGDRLSSQTNAFLPGHPQAALQAYSIVNADLAFPVPSYLSDDEAASICTNSLAPLAAYFGSNSFNWPFPGTEQNDQLKRETLVVIGGGSATGKYAVQLAKLAGVGTIITTAGLDNKAELEKYGATHVLDRFLGDAELEKQVKALTGGDGVKWILDTVNRGEGVEFAAKLLSEKTKGRIMTLQVSKVDSEKFKNKNFDVLHTLGVAHIMGQIAKDYYKVLSTWLEEGKITPLKKWLVIDGLDVDKVNDALDGYATGKTLVSPHVHFH
jgi:NADPH:quinone reductase